MVVSARSWRASAQKVPGWVTIFIEYEMRSAGMAVACGDEVDRRWMVACIVIYMSF